MRESILHFIWKYQYYNIGKAFTDTGEPIQIIEQGIYNTNSGPDFEQVKLKIGNVEWNGDIEIHCKSSDWNTHKHYLDKVYNKVILHVVWEKDKEVNREDTTTLPTLALKLLVEKKIISKINVLINTIKPIPCSSQLYKISDILITNVIQRSLVQRLERKARLVLREVLNSKGDWLEVTYRLIMKQMGMKVNSESFYNLAQIIPYWLIRKYAHSIKSIEALLFGASGFLQVKKGDEYIEVLKKEYQFLMHKHKLTQQLKREQWKFMRLRPSNFPTLRLAQVAALLTNSTNIFDLFFKSSSPNKLIENLKIITSPYWKNHYMFGKKSKSKIPNFGRTSIDLLLLNVASPLLTAYSLHLDNQAYLNKAIELTEYIKHEQNKIIKEWNKIGVFPKNGGESQGLIELFNESCKKKKCLNCAVGFSIIKK